MDSDSSSSEHEHASNSPQMSNSCKSLDPIYFKQTVRLNDDSSDFPFSMSEQASVDSDEFSFTINSSDSGECCLKKVDSRERDRKKATITDVNIGDKLSRMSIILTNRLALIEQAKQTRNQQRPDDAGTRQNNAETQTSPCIPSNVPEAQVAANEEEFALNDQYATDLQQPQLTLPIITTDKTLLDFGYIAEKCCESRSLFIRQVSASANYYILVEMSESSFSFNSNNKTFESELKLKLSKTFSLSSGSDHQASCLRLSMSNGKRRRINFHIDTSELEFHDEFFLQLKPIDVGLSLAISCCSGLSPKQPMKQIEIKFVLGYARCAPAVSMCLRPRTPKTELGLILPASKVANNKRKLRSKSTHQQTPNRPATQRKSKEPPNLSKLDFAGVKY